ncbi:hypothetical protein [uncultured Psychroserpens sp.]|uniref:hypothetical protein n=1 Tax=uncultured Psychroserpens sp. TaxID=255436 RepID=UPI0026213F43|nr:hypothetical protein [uncultured Psychroserpens sp.]
MTDQIKLDFCDVYLYENYMVVTVNTGVNITVKHNVILTDIADSHFKNKPFVYITHRINSYSVDPSVYKETSKITNLVGFCVVSTNFMAKSTAQIEKLFLNKPFEIFDTLPEAFNWAQTLTV